MGLSRLTLKINVRWRHLAGENAAFLAFPRNCVWRGDAVLTVKLRTQSGVSNTTSNAAWHRQPERSAAMPGSARSRACSVDAALIARSRTPNGVSSTKPAAELLKAQRKYKRKCVLPPHRADESVDFPAFPQHSACHVAAASIAPHPTPSGVSSETTHAQVTHPSDRSVDMPASAKKTARLAAVVLTARSPA